MIFRNKINLLKLYKGYNYYKNDMKNRLKIRGGYNMIEKVYKYSTTDDRE